MLFQNAYEKLVQQGRPVRAHAQMDLTKARWLPRRASWQRQTKTIDLLKPPAAYALAMSYAVYSQTQSLDRRPGCGGDPGRRRRRHHRQCLHGRQSLPPSLPPRRSSIPSCPASVSPAPDLIAAEEGAGPHARPRALEGPHEPYPAGGVAAPFSGRIALRDVDIGFRGRKVLSQVTLEIAPGDTIAIIGVSEAGQIDLAEPDARLPAARGRRMFADGKATVDRRLAHAAPRDPSLVPRKPTFFSGAVSAGEDVSLRMAGHERST